MSVLDQVSRMLHMNIDAVMDQAENPEAQLNHITCEMDMTLRHAAAAIAEQLTGIRRTRDALKMAQQLVTAWQEQVDWAASEQQSAEERDAQGHLGYCKVEAQRYEEQLGTHLHWLAEMMTTRDALRAKYRLLLDRREALLLHVPTAVQKTQSSARPAVGDFAVLHLVG